MTVRRTLPQRQRSLIGAWCFVDHYGPDPVADTGGMNVAPHPHTGLQTVSWLFEGEIEHRDSAGNHAMVRPGEVNLMTAGRGISHSEVSTPGTRTLHGAQLWVALPDADRRRRPGLRAPRAAAARPATAGRRGCSSGSLLGDTSPVSTYTPLLGAEILLDPDTRLSARRRPGVRARRARRHRRRSASGDTEAKPADLAYVPTGGERLELTVVRRAGAAAAARRAAVRRADRDVVELRRPQPRRDRRRSARSGRRRSPPRAQWSGTRRR